MKILALIPARMGSSRFPGKPLTPLLGKPMIGHVYARTRMNPKVALTAVATCDQEIADYIKGIGGRVVMTGDHHQRASDRCAEALERIEKEENTTFDIVTMVQGDEPQTHPDMITESAEPIEKDPSIVVTNLLGQIESDEEFEDRNCIKTVCDLAGNALYFSREPIPTRHVKADVPIGKQVCVISFARNFLLEYSSMAPTPLEEAESVDMMRVLEHGLKVFMVPTQHKTHAIDHKKDVPVVEGYLLEDELTQRYKDQI